MSKTTHLIILILAIVAVFASWAFRRALVPAEPTVTDDPSAAPVLESQSTDDVMAQITDQIAHLKELADEDPENAELLTALGNLYYDAGMPEEAIEYYDRVLALQPDNVNVLVDKATMVRVSGDSQAAVNLLNKATELNPNHEQAWFNLGVIYSTDLSNPEGALRAWKKFLAINPNAQHADAVRQEVARLESEL